MVLPLYEHTDAKTRGEFEIRLNDKGSGGKIVELIREYCVIL